jgi:phage FluMu protein Com
MQIRCYRCNWSFAIKNEEVAFALKALEESGGTHYDARCPRCRRTTKISLESLQRAAPRTTAEEEAQEEDISDNNG